MAGFKKNHFLSNTQISWLFVPSLISRCISWLSACARYCCMPTFLLGGKDFIMGTSPNVAEKVETRLEHKNEPQKTNCSLIEFTCCADVGNWTWIPQIDFQIVVRSFLFPATNTVVITVKRWSRINALVLEAAILMRALVQGVVEGDVFGELDEVGVWHIG